jgi:hypothetical protein
MIDITQLQPSTVEALQEINAEHKDIVKYMQNFGTALEKAIAAMILEAVGGREDD